jgi:hypothetical protein
MAKVWLPILLAISCFGQARSSADSTKAPIGVYLTVQFDDPWTKNRIESIVSRELRKLGDVQIVSDPKDASDSLRLLGFPIADKQGSSLGYALSAVATSPSSGLVEIYLDHWIFSGSDGESIENNCNSLVASFDRQVLENVRRVRVEIAAKTPPPCKPSPSGDPKPVLEHKPDCTAWKDWTEYGEAWEAWIRRDAVREFKEQNNPKTLPTTVFK